MKNQFQSIFKAFESWYIVQIVSWILYSLAVITIILIHQNIFVGRTLFTVPLSGSSITFGFPTLIFLLGVFFNFWSIYIEKNVKQKLNKNTFLPALGFSISITFIAFLVTVIITLIEG